MTYGITGNPHKDRIWEPVAELVQWLMQHDYPFCLHQEVADGLAERARVETSICEAHTTEALAREADIVLSFGGDGALLRTAHELNRTGTPIVGVNIGRLGFLADIETERLQEAIRKLENGHYHVEERMALEVDAHFEGTDVEPTDERVELDARWALNEFVIDRSGSAGLITIDVTADGTPLNTYWADGLILATPTGSTAYSLSAGGPIIAPGSDAMILTPIAAHTLTVRPIVLPGSTTLEVRVTARGSYVLATDGHSTSFERDDIVLQIRRADHTVNLAKLSGQHYFKTLRSKLMWGANAL